ncbi:hypothetical protein C5167_011778 [Papaver somniferum]|uniref:nucleolar protein dao-5-like n=1 Tax=Papaver somniferum TaxID=3469 RepID=UPI000E6FCF8D|nr:nucleolar protein dao-5-like [Papaver somniferum]XP_026442741.1 nucleolar protein dao-5-like [Papaver somniferum]XP_026442742.1 nucleolar protein dao-5-like [Papaver somniferum]RZC92697.1 hypothetical protein C5167_011778 [Papaver somniferum]
MGNEQSGHHKNGAEKLKKHDKNKEMKPEETSGVSAVVKQELEDTKEPDATTAEASVGLASVLQVPTDTSSEISTAETVASNQVQIEIPVEKEIPVDTRTGTHEHKAEQPKPAELTKVETFFYECKQEEPAATTIDVIPESSSAVEKPIAKTEPSVAVEKPIAKTEPSVAVEKPVSKAEPNVAIEKPVAKAETNVVVEKPIAKTEPSVVAEKPIAKTEDTSKDLEKPVLLQSLLDLEGNTRQRIVESSRTVDSTIGQSGRTPLLNQEETVEPQKKLSDKQVTELERVSTDTVNAPLLTVMKDDGPESPRKEIVGKENLKRNKSFISSFLCCTAPQ